MGLVFVRFLEKIDDPNKPLAEAGSPAIFARAAPHSLCRWRGTHIRICSADSALQNAAADVYAFSQEVVHKYIRLNLRKYIEAKRGR